MEEKLYDELAITYRALAKNKRTKTNGAGGENGNGNGLETIGGLISGGEEGLTAVEGGGNVCDGVTGGGDGTDDEHEHGRGGGGAHATGGGGGGGGGGGVHATGGGIFGGGGDPGQILGPHPFFSGGRMVGGVITGASWSNLNLREASPDLTM
ncbi:uncharacterized protein LOC110671703 [Hevea brasiliensis]|uniref:uncharacterized protein LOC110671703 n=1 Tax=Hevea brasiliensis TaxID=3981 RepID=UPI0025CF8C22|nr:uncharacterized protein LOC110671703 [Hevea brasiliensis]